MRVTPRGPEVKAIVALLESDDWDSDEALAKAVIKRTCELLSDRDMYAWVYGMGDGFNLAWGPFASESEAKKFAGKYLEMLKGMHMILPLGSPSALEERATSNTVQSQFCQNEQCTHSIVSHEHPKKNGKCAARGCKCKKVVIE